MPPGQSLLVLQVSIGDQLALGMLAKPALTMSEELFHFRITNPIVLIVVKDRDQHIKMRQQITQPKGAFEPNGVVVGTLTPLREFLVERMSCRCLLRNPTVRTSGAIDSLRRGKGEPRSALRMPVAVSASS